MAVVPSDTQASSRNDAQITRHETFYFEDCTVIFKVEDTLFGVHRTSFSRHSPVFRDMWTLPSPANGPPGEGTSDEVPIRLEGVTVDEFASLCNVLYPAEYGTTPFKTLDDWLLLLNVATRFDFEGIRTYALNSIQRLPNLTPIQKINLARQYNVNTAWIVGSLTELVRRYTSITEEEAQALGAEYVSKLSNAREAWITIQSMRNAYASLTCNDCRTVDANMSICAECGSDLDAYVEVPSEILTPTMFVLDTFKLTPDGRPRENASS